MSLKLQFWKRVSFQIKIAIHFAISIFILAWLFFLTYANNKSSYETGKWVEHTDEVLWQNQKTLSYAEELETSVRGFLLSGKEEHLNLFFHSAYEIRKSVGELKNMTLDNLSHQKKISSLEKLVNDNLQFRKRLIELRRRNGFISAYTLFATGEGARKMDTLRTIVAQLEAGEKQLLTKRKAINETTINNLTQTINLLAVLVLTLLIIGFIIIYRNINKRNKTQNELTRGNFFIRSIIDNSPNPISVRDVTGKYTLANEPILQILNKKENEIIGKTLTEIFPEELASLLAQADAEIIQSRSTVTKEYQLSFSNRLRYLSSSSFPLFDEKNNIYAVGSILTDITELKKGEQALQQSKNQLLHLLNVFQQLMDTSTDAVCIIDEEGCFKELSSGAEKLLGYSADELIGKKYIDFVHEQDKKKTNEAAENVMLGIPDKDFENRYYRKDGTFIHLSWVALWCEDEKLMYCIGRDASEKKQTLKQLRDSEAILAKAQEIAKLGNWEIDLKSSAVKCSDMFYEIIGRSRQEMGGAFESYKRIIFPDEINNLCEVFSLKMQQQDAFNKEFRILKPNGGLINVKTVGEVIFDEGGQPVLITGTLQDITERKILEEEREMVSYELTKSNADLKQFSFITSHNFRAPLSNIIGILSLINYQGLDDYNTELLQMLKTSTEQLNKTIEDITNILIIKNNQQEVTENVCLNDVYSKVENAIKIPLLEAKGRIVTSFKITHLQVNSVYLESILFNLLSNAITFRSATRKLEVKVTSDRDENGNTVLTVSDNGIGIDLIRNKNKIFGLYQRFHLNSKGRGLGLFMVKSQVAAMGGCLEVNSEVEKGTSLSMTFNSFPHANS